MQKSIIAAALAIAAAGPALAAGFTGAAAPADWAVSNTGTLVGGSPMPGTATFDASQLVLVGSDTTNASPNDFTAGCAGGTYASLGPCQTQAVLDVKGLYTFDWSYVSSDGAGPAGDIFGVVVDGRATTLSNLGGSSTQSGTASFDDVATFGWFVNCSDCLGGSATVTVSNFTLQTPAAAVPEPGTGGLMIAGLAALVFRRWQKRRSAA